MSSVFYRDLGANYPVAARGEGMYLYSEAGDQYLDMSGGAAVSCLGHGHQAVVAAVQRQVNDLAFAHTAFFTNASQEALAKRLAARFSEYPTHARREARGLLVGAGGGHPAF